MSILIASRTKNLLSGSFLTLLSACAPTLTGQLMNAQGEPVSNDAARVNIAPLASPAHGGDQHTLILTVDRNGRFVTKAPLSPGEYLVEALVPGYTIAASRIKIDGTKESHRQPLVLKLSSLGATSARSTSANLNADDARGSGGASLTPPNF